MLALAACGSAASTGSTTGRVTVRWRDKGHTVNVSRGTHILVKLSNTYWHVSRSSNRAVIRKRGKTVRREGGTCPPGVGCGTTIARFLAVGNGTAHIRAWRTSCGEALKCTHGQGRYDVAIRVS